MPTARPVSRVIDLCDPGRNRVYGLDTPQARALVARGDVAGVAGIQGHFALVGCDGTTVRLARTLSRPLRYFIAKRNDGPILIVSERIDAIARWLRAEGLADQFHPSYTRMVPAHHVVEIRLVGCPDPNPGYHRFFIPQRGFLPADLDLIGHRYVSAVYDEISRWLRSIPTGEPLGVCFSGGVDSGAVFLLTYHALLSLGMNPGRLKAFTLSVNGGGSDSEQARDFLRHLDLELFWEPLETSTEEVDVGEAVRVVEDYKPLDVEAAAVNVALLRGIRERYPDWRFLLDGDGGDENLKDYPLEENAELTIRSVLSNPLLYQEGWGVDSIKHSLTYSGGQSRGCTRSAAPAAMLSFDVLSPYTALPVIAVAEGIPFIELTEWDAARLYRLKGEIVSRGVRAVTGLEMPVLPKRRFQRGAMSEGVFRDRFAKEPATYRRMFQALYE